MRFPLSPLRGSLPSERVSVEARSDGRRLKREREQRRRRLRNRRIKAILAGGLVFGIGAAATLAAWTDTEEASGSFEAGTFTIDLSVNGSTWNNTSQMSFNASGMYPGSKVYAPVFVRTTPNTTMDGELTVESQGATGDASDIAGSLEYRAVTEPIASGQEGGFKDACKASKFSDSSTYVFGNSSAGSQAKLKTAAPGAGKQALSRTSGSVRAYCFEVTLPTNTPSAAQGTTASNIWKFNAESVPTENS